MAEPHPGYFSDTLEASDPPLAAALNSNNTGRSLLPRNRVTCVSTSATLA